MRELLDIPVDAIEVGERLRPLNLAKVEQIADSLRTQGQIAPIEVSPRGPGKWNLVAGWHRLEAAKRAGRMTIEARRFDGDPLLREVEENLARNELSIFERAFFLEAWLGRIGVGVRGNTEKSVSDQGFAIVAQRLTGEIAERVGLAKRSIYYGLLIARRLRDAKDDLAGTTVANSHHELLALAKMDPQKRAPVIAALKAGKTFQEALPPRKEPANKKEKHLGALKAAWNKCSKEAKTSFVWMHRKEIERLLARLESPE